MTSTQAEIDQSYSVSNDFFALWLDENMHYTCAVFDGPDDTLEAAQERKADFLYDLAELGPDKTVLDIGSGWGSFLDVAHRRGIRHGTGITLSTAQVEWARERGLSNVDFELVDYAEYEPEEPFDALVSIEMIDHLCSPAQARQGRAVELYRAYFDRLGQWVKPGSLFACQAILSDRVPRTRSDLEDLAFTADIIFPGGRNPRLEELVMALRPTWEIEALYMRRVDYGRTTQAWLDRLLQNEATIRETWGDVVMDDYIRYLRTCVRAFDAEWSGDVQMKLRRSRA